MIELRDKTILIDGRPRLVLSGEVHYFRLRREDWQDRLDKLKAAGCNTVASYIPWLCHETVEGRIDLDGRSRPELDLGAFIDLCRANGLWFIARPGPFVMAELKNEGLPYWLYEKHPEIVPVGWDGKPATTHTVDYLAPGFLDATRRWYDAVMAVITPRLQPGGGNVIALQLDNEIGMLSWLSNCPDLTENVLADFAAWLKVRHRPESLRKRYPFDPDEPEARRAGIRSPAESYALALLRDLGHYMRDRFARYVATLRSWAETAGIRGIPFVVNIHGTGGGRALSFPIGISQLYPSYTQDFGYLSGSDFYLGNLTFDNFQDLYLCNAFMEAVHRPEQPLASMEFECGDGNYGNTYGNRLDPSAADFKARMCLAQGARLLNYYLFTGGHNYRLDPPPPDGDGRIAFTGERHGFAAPVDPDGRLNYSYPRLANLTRTVAAVADKLAAMWEEHDRVAFGFIPDYFMTESRHPASAAMATIVRNLEANRGPSAWETMARAMLLGGYRFGAVDLQNRPLDVKTTPVLALGSARYMDTAVQRKLADWLSAGGGLLLYGEVPLYGMEGEPCTLLAEALGAEISGFRQASERYFLALAADGWARPRPEVRSHFAQTFAAPLAEALLRVCDTGEICGFETAVGKGRAVVIGTAYPCDIALFRTALERLGAVAALRHDCENHGIFMTSTANAAGERFIHLLNLDGFDKRFHLYEDGRPLFDGHEIELRARDGVMLPLTMRFGEVKIEYATAEITAVNPDRIEFRATRRRGVIAVETARKLRVSPPCELRQDGPTTYGVLLRPAPHHDRIILCHERTGDG
ncbi:beta-galactosidase [Methylococcus capsulatus]|uniref:beta-galactosidase n=1 Tax=Methylococcus capsulatus TaxID=414 RepID=UPI002FDAC867